MILRPSLCAVENEDLFPPNLQGLSFSNVLINRLKEISFGAKMRKGHSVIFLPLGLKILFIWNEDEEKTNCHFPANWLLNRGNQPP
jgi:hypothetical protein